MKKILCIFLAIASLFCSACAKKKEYILTEDTFFLVMTNMQYYPEQYVNCTIEYDCFMYELTDVNGEKYTCGVRKCSSGYGCTCGQDTIIGFILDYAEELPAPRNQSEDSNEKTWIHLKGTLKDAKKTEITIPAYLPSGELDGDKTETISFLVFSVENYELIKDYSKLHYYVTK